MESVAASILSVLCFNFFFIAPKYSLDVHNPEYIVTFIAMLAVSLSISGLIARIRLQNLIVSKREKRALTLYDAGREINKAQNQSEILLSTQNSILRLGDLDCGILLYNDHALHTGVSSRSFFELEAEEFAVAKFVMDRKEAAGYSTETLPGAAGLYLPLKTERNLYGVCAISPLIDGKNQERLDIEVRQTIELILQQAALCLERLTLELNARETQIKIETEGMRSLILSSVSHDFRTPLTVIEGAAEQINLSSESSSTTKELAKLILDHGHRLSRVVHNALSFAKLEGKAPKLNLEWESIEELIGQAIEKYRDKLKNREIKIEYPEDLPLIRVDAVLIDQLIVNVLENSLIHAKTATYLGIKVELEENTLIITISDNGPGLQGVVDGNKLMQDTDSHTGSGIGVKICELITKLHSGSFELKAGILGGVESIIRLPLNATKPSQTPFAETAGHDN